MHFLEQNKDSWTAQVLRPTSQARAALKGLPLYIARVALDHVCVWKDVYCKWDRSGYILYVLLSPLDLDNLLSIPCLPFSL